MCYSILKHLFMILCVTRALKKKVHLRPSKGGGGRASPSAPSKSGHGDNSTQPTHFSFYFNIFCKTISGLIFTDLFLQAYKYNDSLLLIYFNADSLSHLQCNDV